MDFREKYELIEEAKKVCEDAGYEVLMEGIDDLDDGDSLDLASTVANAIQMGDIDATEFALAIIDYLSSTNKQALESFLESNDFM